MITEEIMAEIDLALDDIISKQKPMNRSNNGKRRAQRIDEPLTSTFRGGGGVGWNRRGFGGKGRSGSFGGDGRIGFSGNKRRDGQSDVVWINIANLPESVVTDDLKELFQDFSVQGLGVHYDEFGQHMGTADLFVDARSAKAILREYANIAIDGQRIRFAIVNEQAADTPQFQSHQRRAGGRQPVRPHFNRPRPNTGIGRGGRSDSQQSTRTYSRSRSPLNRVNRGFGGVSRRNNPSMNQRKNSAATHQEMKSTDELDRELEAYMKGNKHPRIKLDE